MNTPDIIEEKVQEFYSTFEGNKFEASYKKLKDIGDEKVGPYFMSDWLTETLTTIYQRGREDENRDIIKMAESCTDCGKPKHIHPHDFYDNDLDCNCPAKK